MSWIILLTMVPMFLTWGVAYALIIVQCFREKTYGVPLLGICLNISWEATYAFNPPESYPDLLQYGNVLWVVLDSVILYQLFRFGREQQAIPFVRRFYYPILVLLLAFSWLAVRGFRDYFNDPYGLVTAWILGVVSALAFVPFASSRVDDRGLSYSAAWLMLLGNIVSAIFCYFWWPLQFSSGRLKNEPTSFVFLYVFYVFVPCCNIAHVWILRERRQGGGSKPETDTRAGLSAQAGRYLQTGLIIAACLFLPSSALAADLSGRVVNEAGSGMAEVRVRVAPDGPTVTTDGLGNFVIGGLAPGKYRLVFFMEPGLSHEREVDIVEGPQQALTFLIEAQATPVLFSSTVTAVSRNEEPLLQAPAAATRLGSDEIQRSSLSGQAPRLFAMLPGVEVVQNGLYDFNFNVRGFNTMVSTRVLTRLDGRDPSVPINIGTPNWAELTFVMEELEAAELVRGPSSALYGASAYNGLVDFRTTDPKQSSGGKLRITAGGLRTQRYYASHSGKLADAWYFRVLGGFHHSGTFSRSRVGVPEYSLGAVPPEAIPLPTTTEQIATAAGRLDHYLGDNTLVVVEGGTTRPQGQTTVTGLGRSQATDVSRPWANVRFRGPSWQVSSFYTGQRQNNQINLTSGQPSFISAYNAGLEGQIRSRVSSGRAELLGGFALGRQHADSKDPAGRQTVLGAPSQANRGAVFGQVATSLTERLKVYLTGRVDKSSLFNARFSPRVAVVYSPFSKHSVRASFNDSFQQAGLVSYFLDTPIAPPVDLSGLETALKPLLGTTPLGFEAIPIIAVGSPNLVVEKIRSFEVGYTAAPGSRWLFTFSFYKNRSKDFATNLLPQVGTSLGRLNPAFGPYQPPAGLSDTAAAAVLRTLDAVLPAALRPTLSQRPNGSPVFVPLSLTNFGVVDSHGTELEVSKAVSKRWLLRANVSNFNFKVRREAPESLLVPNAPKYQAKAVVLYLANRFDASAHYRWVNRFPWSSGIYQGVVPSYSLVDMNANYRLSRLWSIGADIANLLDNQHYELFGGDLLGRRALVSLTLRW